MGTPMPERDPYSEALGEAVQTAVMAVRLLTAIADAVAEAAEKRAQKTRPPLTREAVTTAEDKVREILPTDLTTALLGAGDWPQMARQLAGLQQAGVDLGDLLPRVGEMAVGVRDAVLANRRTVEAAGTEEWATLLRQTMPAGPVREAILASPGWPEIAATMSQLQERDVDVRKVLVAAHAEGVGVDQAVARVLDAAATEPVSQDALRSYGPLTEGLDIPRNLDLSDREGTLAKLAVGPATNARYVRWVGEALGSERAAEAAQVVRHRQWPFLAARMAAMEDSGAPDVAAHLGRLTADTAWAQGPREQLGERLVMATHKALTAPAGEAVGGAERRVSAAAARAQSVTVGPTAGQAKSGAPAEAATVVPAPARGPKRTR
ncbi:hypothetical protein [Streptomyces sp. NPDC088360]|uniref:hypothetical protein n=1 Tax=Streptomyces sp. NPDC088360 TaxID=3154515 RepID=UPI00344C9A18